MGQMDIPEAPESLSGKRVSTQVCFTANEPLIERSVDGLRMFKS